MGENKSFKQIINDLKIKISNIDLNYDDNNILEEINEQKILEKFNFHLFNLLKKKKNNLTQKDFSQIINGKYQDNKWPTNSQKNLLKKSIKYKSEKLLASNQALSLNPHNLLAPSSNTEKKTFSKEEIEKEFTIINVAKDGNCLFHAIMKLDNKYKDHNKFREDLYNQWNILKNKKNGPAKEWFYKYLNSNNSKNGNKNHHEVIKNNSVFCGLNDLIIISNKLIKRPVILYVKDRNQNSFNKLEIKLGTITNNQINIIENPLYLILSNNHFEGLEKKIINN